MAEQYWAACQTITGREHVVRAEIEKMERGAFVPTFVRSWVTGGKLSVSERAAIPGYVFFRSSHDGWPPVKAIDGVIDVLLHADKARRVSSNEMARMMLDHATGANNRFDGCISLPARNGRRKKSSRKPRPSKRARAPRSSTVP